MKINNALKRFSFIIIVGILLQSCATILGGKTNTLVFSDESLPEAKIFIDGDFIGDAPGKIKVPKEKIQHGSILVIKAEGYENLEYVLLRKQNAAYSVADILIGGIPLALDFSTGNIYRPKPRNFKYELKKQD
jgi:hypothetical protein